MRWLLLLILLPLLALAETWTGPTYVVDGDTIYVRQTRLRPLDMAAFESAQNCVRDGKDYACGSGHRRPEFAPTGPGTTL